LVQHKPYNEITIKYTKWPQNIPHCRKIDLPAVKIYQHLPLQEPTKFTQIGIFGLKTVPSGNPGCGPHYYLKRALIVVGTMAAKPRQLKQTNFSTPLLFGHIRAREDAALKVHRR
jgi:hypothetical protein